MPSTLESGIMPAVVELDVVAKGVVVTSEVVLALALVLGVVASVSEFTAADMLLANDCPVAVVFSADWTCRLISRGK